MLIYCWRQFEDIVAFYSIDFFLNFKVIDVQLFLACYKSMYYKTDFFEVALLE